MEIGPQNPPGNSLAGMQQVVAMVAPCGTLSSSTMMMMAMAPSLNASSLLLHIFRYAVRIWIFPRFRYAAW